jgi:hypothetical protein
MMKGLDHDRVWQRVLKFTSPVLLFSLDMWISHTSQPPLCLGGASWLT